MNKRIREYKRFTQCPNCNEILSVKDNYCSNCGQKNEDYRQPIKSLILDLLGDLFLFDNRIWRNFRLLYKNPAKLSDLYIKGVRKRFVPPLRVFLFLSFILLLIFSYNYKLKFDDDFDENIANQFFNGGFKKVLNNEEKDSLINYKDLFLIRYSKEFQVDKEDIEVILDSLNSTLVLKPKESAKLNFGDNLKVDVNSFRKNWENNEYLDSLIQPTYNNSLSRYLKKIELKGLSTELFSSEYENNAKKNKFFSKIFQIFSYYLLLLLPISSFFLFMLFRKSRPYFYETLIYNINYHNFMFLWLIIVFVLENLLSFISVGFSISIRFIFVLFMLYFIVSTQWFYKGSWLKTSIKSFIYFILYALLFIIGLSSIFIYSLNETII